MGTFFMKVYIILRSNISTDETWVEGVYRNKLEAEDAYKSIETSDNLWIEEHEVK